MSFFYLWGPALGPVVTGAVYDRDESYDAMMSVFVVVALIAACLYASLVKPAPDGLDAAEESKSKIGRS
jgi:hypothetical protein